MTQNGLLTGEDGVCRCGWAGPDPLYRHYHDEEWGQPVADDTRLFEKIVLEGFQSGLSWLTILKKRENFRAAFAGFDLQKVAAFEEEDVQRLLQDAGIVRHQGKIRSAINNAARALELQDEAGSLAAFFWSFEPPANERPDPVTWDALIANPATPTSRRLAKELKKRGWSFVGPTTAYAFMQAMGLVNDHVEGCGARARCEEARKRFVPPA
ncbi:DNA-3-methyladenine glycosylase I [Notoacmeibacter sp. MSK16QG-6]|uniref:DNA-3-methyladenine glycosylase I n=1 Tax=Notoacmeibacter sp. MSK16QG-6 TaxID=2957982 RepID=UPI00209FBFA2|nr:DNA-3-methyladenine glycosylase I [Notoacmeibacter sp. MSK16QG-6]MCP1198521.1 DNA-3-methyladenine glycosylase I [Notoacmeibacter sp. MSK16QG-6]